MTFQMGYLTNEKNVTKRLKLCGNWHMMLNVINIQIKQK